jgi:malto-oligosyltrehalose trehalohydrolase
MTDVAGLSEIGSWHPEAITVAERELPAYLLRQRWYPAKDAVTPTVSLQKLIPMEEGDGNSAMAVWNIRAEGREPFSIFFPLAVVDQAAQEDLAGPMVVARLPDGRTLVDATERDSFVKALVLRILHPSRQQSSAVTTGHTHHIAALEDTPQATWQVKRSSVEQSNTSIRLADKSILKVIRKLSPGIHPELEMSRFLTEVAHFRATPTLLGWIDVTEETVAILQEFIPNEGDGWSWSRSQLKAGKMGADRAIRWLALLGERTAEMHAALNVNTADAAFNAEAAESSDWLHWTQDLAAMAGRVRDSLRASESHLDAQTLALAQSFRDKESALEAWLGSFVASPPAWCKTRHHGDFHLGQVLVAGEDAAIVDFEGEPLRSLEQRRAKQVPLRDIAGMVRSIQYVGATLLRELPPSMPAEGQEEETARLNDWTAAASGAFVQRYLRRLQEKSCDPVDATVAERIIDFFLIEKAMYEVLYELSNRPTWTSVPLQYLNSRLQLIGPAEKPLSRTRHHDMPFGADSRGAGGVRFRLWAPHCPEIAVVTRTPKEAQERIANLVRSEDGWHELIDPQARPGTLYQYLLPDGTRVPDPASRFQPQDVHGPSEVIDPTAFAWSGSWSARPWAEAVIYELHVGAFTPEGTFLAAIERLDHLVALGVSAIELMPIADFPGTRNWGYDGVLWYAPDSSYGRPEDLKCLIEAAHKRGIMVILDVVYNHLGPDGNFLPSYAPGFFTDRHKTPWGAAINFDGQHAGAVREFVIHNALYWLEEYNLDGLRLDAVHAILDDSPEHLLQELARRVRAAHSRPIHLLLENEENAVRWLSREAANEIRAYSAQWNDDVHHVLHVAATGEAQGYYADYAGQTEKLGRALAEGFAYQGEIMPFSARPRGEPSGRLPPTAFVAFIQNHDQIGNRAFGDRIIHGANEQALRAIASIYLLLPQIPMLFMGEEWGSQQPFPFFCDFHGALGEAVRKGRREEFAKFPQFQDESNRQRIPDPQAEATFLSAKLRWEEAGMPDGMRWLTFYRGILKVRRTRIVPLLSEMRCGGTFKVRGAGAVEVNWKLDPTDSLSLKANLSNATVTGFTPSAGRLIWQEGSAEHHQLSPWSVCWDITYESKT